ncbi:hypothetical protein GCM10009539_36040 [Cryptosporangium japonicum]|uniref:Uncharacterized protein n=1 Tax=Cryptosporangium japonicum TaxID=80872 RepID=A0ABP3DZ32_9ACTN
MMSAWQCRSCSVGGCHYEEQLGDATSDDGQVAGEAIGVPAGGVTPPGSGRVQIHDDVRVGGRAAAVGQKMASIRQIVGLAFGDFRGDGRCE